MKFMSRYTLVAIAALGMFAPPALAGGTITDIVSESGGEFDNNRYDYDILLNAVVTAGLAEALDDPDADLTVFAPNDAAFKRLAKDLGWDRQGGEEGAWLFLVGALTELGGGDPIPVLTDVLLYHVAPESLTFFDVIIKSFFRQDIVTAQGGTITPYFFKLIDNEPDLRNPFLFVPFNVQASNGIIHTISRVLIPVDLP